MSDTHYCGVCDWWVGKDHKCSKWRQFKLWLLHSQMAEGIIVFLLMLIPFGLLIWGTITIAHAEERRRADYKAKEYEFITQCVKDGYSKTDCLVKLETVRHSW